MGAQHSGVVHHDRTLHQMMLAEDSKAWDQRHGSCGFKELYAADLASRMSETSLADACSPSHASPTDSASSLHADCVLAQDYTRERAASDAASPLLRCAPVNCTLAYFNSQDLIRDAHHLLCPSADKLVLSGQVCKAQQAQHQH